MARDCVSRWRATVRWSLAVVGLVALASCGTPERDGKPAVDPRDRVGPRLHPALRESVGEIAALTSSTALRVEGYGIVADLPGTGSGEMPPAVRSILTDQLSRYGGSFTQGTGDIRPERILESNRIAVVEVRGVIPPMAVKGTPFDLTLTSLPGTQTTSLEGGLLWTADLKVIGLSETDLSTRTIARGRGQVFCEPALPATTQPTTASAGQAAKRNLRKGRVLAGGVTTEDMQTTLQLYSPSYRGTRLIERVVNARFPARPPYAVAQGDSLVTLRIPPEYAGNPREFVDLVTHMYLAQEVPGYAEKKAVELIAALRDPKAPHMDLSLALQGLGRAIIMDYLRPQYTSDNIDVRFFTARAGAFMQDVQAMIVMETLAQDSTCLRQLQAIQALGQLGARGETSQATVVLAKLLNSQNTELRLAAYEALRAMHSPAVRSFRVPQKFDLDLVYCEGPSMIYATQAGVPRIALIGQQFDIQPGSLYVSPDDRLTINFAEDAEGSLPVTPPVAASSAVAPATQPVRKEPVQIYYRRANSNNVLLKSSANLGVVLSKIGFTPDPLSPTYDPRQPFIGMHYQQIVELLATLCREHFVEATFMLQPPPKLDQTLIDLAEEARPEGPVLTPSTSPATRPAGTPAVQAGTGAPAKR